MMKVALISDIHGNMIAFDLCLKDLDHEKLDGIIFLGDYVTDGPESSKILSVVKKLGTHVILGNREKYMLNYDEKKKGFINYDTIADTYESLTKSDLDFIESLEEYKIIDLNGFKTLLIHGDGYFKYGMEYSDFFDSLIANFEFDVCLFGHTHEHIDVEYKGKRFINPGSIGQSSDYPTYKYCILDVSDEIRVNLREFKVNDTFQELVDYYKKSEYYARHEIWCNLILLLIRDSINYPNEFIEYFNSKLPTINGSDKDKYNKLYKECYKEFIKDVNKGDI